MKKKTWPWHTQVPPCKYTTTPVLLYSLNTDADVKTSSASGVVEIPGLPHSTESAGSLVIRLATRSVFLLLEARIMTLLPVMMIKPSLLPSQTLTISWLNVCFGVCVCVFSSAVDSLQLPFVSYTSAHQLFVQMNHQFEWSLQCISTQLERTSHGFSFLKCSGGTFELYIPKLIIALKTIQMLWKWKILISLPNFDTITSLVLLFLYLIFS